MIDRFRKRLAPCGLMLALAAAPTMVRADLVYIGMQGPRIHVLRFDPGSGSLSMIGPAFEGPRATWTVPHPRLPILYAVDDDKARPGSAIALAVDRDTGMLTRIDAAPTGGEGSTYLSLDKPAATLFAANFGSGSVSSIALDRNGSLGALVSTVAATGSGPHKRQASAHAHAAVVDPSGRYVLVPDLGADRVFVYAFDRASGAMAPADAADPRAFATAPGSGPRHLAFGADGRFAYLLNELSGELMVLRWDAAQGRLARVQALSISSAGFEGVRSGAEIAVSGDGRFAYVADRGENTLVVYGVDAGSGELTLVQRTPSGGATPWNLALHPSGRWLLVANQRSATVNVFGVDPASGKLTDSGKSVATPAPVSISFVK